METVSAPGYTAGVTLIAALWASWALAGPPDSAPTSWEPEPAPPPTAWAVAGARSWRLCDEIGRQARASEAGSRSTREASEEVWAKRVRQCPHEPIILMLAAQSTIGEAMGTAWPEDPAGFDALAREQHRRMERAQQWLATALREARRRGEQPPLGVHYYRAYVLLAAGRPREAQIELNRAIELGEVERWRSERMGAVIALLLGRLEPATRLAHRGVINAPFEDRTISRVIWALVLDRSGAPAAARDQLQAVRREAGSVRAIELVETLLPFHERLYLRALDRQAADDRSGALRLWEAYLARSEPQDPERELARRHLAELRPPPPPVGGPMG